MPASHGRAHVTFRPGRHEKLGMGLDKETHAVNKLDVGQAQKAGVEIGWVLKKVGTRPFSFSVLKKALKGFEPISCVFELPEEAAKRLPKTSIDVSGEQHVYLAVDLSGGKGRPKVTSPKAKKRSGTGNHRRQASTADKSLKRGASRSRQKKNATKKPKRGHQRAKSDAAFSLSRKSKGGNMTTMLKEFDEEKKQIKADHEREKVQLARTLTESFQKEIADLRAKLDAGDGDDSAGGGVLDEDEKVMDRSGSAHRREPSGDMGDLIGNLDPNKKTMKEQLDEQFEKIQKHESEIERIKSEHSDELSQLQKQHEESKQKIASDHGEAQTTLRKEHEEMQTKLREEHEEIQKNMREEHEFQLKERDDIQRKMREDHQQQLQDVRDSYKDELETAKTLRAEGLHLIQEHKLQKEELTSKLEKHETAINLHKEQHKSFKEDLESKIDELENEKWQMLEEFADEKDAIRKKHQEELELKVAELQEEKSAIEQKHAEEVEMLKGYMTAEFEEEKRKILREAHDEREKMKAKEEEFNLKMQDYETRISELMNTQIEELKEINVHLEQVKAECDVEKQGMLEQHQSELEELKRKLEEDKASLVAEHNHALPNYHETKEQLVAERQKNMDLLAKHEEEKLTLAKVNAEMIRQAQRAEKTRLKEKWAEEKLELRRNKKIMKIQSAQLMPQAQSIRKELQETRQKFKEEQKAFLESFRKAEQALEHMIIPYH